MPEEDAMAIQSINPATGEVLETLEPTSPPQIQNILAGAHAAFLDWRTQPFARRSTLMRAAARELRTRKDEYALTMTREMGKPIVQAEAEVEKCAGTCDYYAEHAEAFLAEQPRETDASPQLRRASTRSASVLAVMPWNFPFWQVFRFAAPALMAGNAGILKHASNVPRCALAIEEVFRRAGFPEGLFRTVLADSAARQGPDRRSAHRRGHPDRQRARGRGGRRSRRGASSRRRVLELGGSDPFIVLADADLDAAARDGRARRRLINSGQSCIAAKRFIVVEPVARSRSSSGSTRELAPRRMGDPTRARHAGRPAGPRRPARRAAPPGRGVGRSAAPGALLGGSVPTGKGAFYPPTVLAGGATAACPPSTRRRSARSPR